MAGTFARNDQQRVAFLYPSDNGTNYVIYMQPKYATGSGLTRISGPPNGPVYPYSYRNLRHIYIRTTESAPTSGRLHSRRVPCAKFTGNQGPGSFEGLDGLTGWKHGKLIGERRPV